MCPQRPGRLDFVTGPLVADLHPDEDCLVLSVTAPRTSDVRGTGFPVMVWFHGGAYVAGGGEAPKYDPAALAGDGQVVVVRVTYRLGIFGYLAPANADADDNLGLQDQILALRWVRENIASFGGDPGNVTVFGQSAGGDSVVALMLSVGTQGLFHRAIAQSAPMGLGTAHVDSAEDRAAMAAVMREAMGRTLAGVSPREATVDQLLVAEGAAVVAAQRFPVLGGMAFAPLLGRDPLPAAAEVPARFAEAARCVEVMIGYTRDDATPFIAMQPGIAALRPDFVRRQAIRAGAARMTRRVFGDDSEKFAEQWRDAGGQAVTYRFDWSPDDTVLGACHCLELPHLFGAPDSWSDAPMLGTRRRPDEGLAERMRSVWAAFAHGGAAALPAHLTFS